MKNLFATEAKVMALLVGLPMALLVVAGTVGVMVLGRLEESRRKLVVTTIQTHRAEIRTCFASKSRESRPVEMAWTILPSGRAVEVAAINERDDDLAVRGCLAKSVRGWHFPKTAIEDGPVPVRYRFAQDPMRESSINEDCQ